MSENNLFEEYLKKKPGFFQQPKSWVILVTALAAVALMVVFYQSVIVGGMSVEEVANSVQVIGPETMWVDKEVTPQGVAIVPAIRLKIKNVGTRPLQYMDIEAVFEYVESGMVHSDGMVRILKEPLQPGEETPEVLVQALYGYSAKSHGAFMKNKKNWKKMQAKLFVRTGGSSLVRVGELYPVKQVIDGYREGEDENNRKPTEYQDAPTRELAASIRIIDQDSIWLDKVATAREVIIVPSITIDIKNVGEKNLQNLYFKGVFRYEDTGEILSQGLTPALDKPLEPGKTAGPIEIIADFGYSATSTEAFYRNNSKWKLLKVDLYAKSKESRDALLGTYPIKQKIRGVKVIYKYQRP